MSNNATHQRKDAWMPMQTIARHGLTHPFGDERTVQQAFPNAIPTQLSDPFLMCDYFNMPATETAQHADDFPIDWHPHRGFDICSYLKREKHMRQPGMQWMSTGSGVEHAEGGATPVGQLIEGFQIWINVPADKKWMSPRYGTVPPHELSLIPLVVSGSGVRVLAGEAFGTKGPFETVQPVQMMDFELQPSHQVAFSIADGLDTTIVYVYDGDLNQLNDWNQESSIISTGSVILMDASSQDKRGMGMTAGPNGAKIMVFAGQKLREPIAWHGPIVMNTHEQATETIREIRSGQFPPARVPWDYKKIETKPKEEL